MRRPSLSIRGFTLVELLVSMAITIGIVVLLARVLAAAASIWQLADQRIDTFRDARAAMQLMTNDLGRADINGDPQMLTLGDISSDGTYAGSASAVAPMKNTGKSDLCAVTYYLNWNGGVNAYSLSRSFKDSDATASILTTPPLSFTNLYTRTTPETLANYAWDMEIRPGEVINTLTPTTDSSTKWKWIEVRFKAMSVKAARKFQSSGAVGQATWADPTTAAYKTYILPNEQQFVTRILLQQNQ